MDELTMGSHEIDGNFRPDQAVLKSRPFRRPETCWTAAEGSGGGTIHQPFAGSCGIGFQRPGGTRHKSRQRRPAARHWLGHRGHEGSTGRNLRFGCGRPGDGSDRRQVAAEGRTEAATDRSRLANLRPGTGRQVGGQNLEPSRHHCQPTRRWCTWRLQTNLRHGIHYCAPATGGPIRLRWGFPRAFCVFVACAF